MGKLNELALFAGAGGGLLASRHRPFAGTTIATAKLYGNNKGGAAGRVGKVRPSLESLTGGVYPALREWMMGWPINWTALEPLEMDRFREWLRSHGAF